MGCALWAPSALLLLLLTDSSITCSALPDFAPQLTKLEPPSKREEVAGVWEAVLV